MVQVQFLFLKQEWLRLCLRFSLGSTSQQYFYFCLKNPPPYFWMLTNTLGVSLGSHSTNFLLGDTTQGLVPDLQSLLSLKNTQDILLPQAPQLQGLPRYLPCCFLSHHKPAASPSALFFGVIPEKDGLLFWFVLLISCTLFLSSLYNCLTE